MNTENASTETSSLLAYYNNVNLYSSNFWHLLIFGRIFGVFA